MPLESVTILIIAAYILKMLANSDKGSGNASWLLTGAAVMVAGALVAFLHSGEES
jgi:hypothetical protein